MARCRHVQDPDGPVSLAGTDPEPPRLVTIIPDDPNEEKPIATDREGPPVAPGEMEEAAEDERSSERRRHHLVVSVVRIELGIGGASGNFKHAPEARTVGVHHENGACLHSPDRKPQENELGSVG